MDERSRRIGKNEALFRTVNEEIEKLSRGLAAVADGTLHIVCECGHATCQDQLVVPIEDYERVRGDSALFIVVPGHDLPSVEDVVESGDRYSVVRKKPGAPERIAEATDLRSDEQTA